MAPNPTMTYSFTNGTPADAAQVNANFATLTAWLAANGMQIDGSVAFTGIPSGPASDPTTANQLTRKSYVDDKMARFRGGYTGVLTATPTAVTLTETEDTGGFFTSGSAVTIVTSGMYLVGVVGTGSPSNTDGGGFGGGGNDAVTVTPFLQSTELTAGSVQAGPGATKYGPAMMVFANAGWTISAFGSVEAHNAGYNQTVVLHVQRLG